MSEFNDLELRVLSGLHRGASLPIDDQPQLIGAADDADIVLVDPGIELRHAVLRLDGQIWSLLSLDGIVRGAAADVPADQPQLAPGDCARVGRIWVTVTSAQAPWQDPPADPPAPAAPLVDAPVLEAQTAPPVDQAFNDDATDDLFSVSTPAGVPTTPAIPAPAVKPRTRRSRMVLLPVVLGAGLMAAAAYAYTARPGAPAQPIASRSLVVPAPTARTASPLRPHDLRQAFRQRLADVDLLRRFELTLDDHAWTLRAALDEDESARFRRILAAFVATHRITFPIDVTIGGADTMLPFKVRQVISGANASIVTDDGRRLYPGDDHRGVRLVAIDANRITFNGAQPIEIKW